MKQAKMGGYTLLEILVVLIIISIASTMAVLTIGHNHNKELESLTKDLVQSLTLAEEQALLQPSTLGLVVTSANFRFYEYRQKDSTASWAALSDRAFAAHSIPSGIQLRIKVDGKELAPAQKEETIKPSLLLFNNGNMTPFTILIGLKDKKPRYELIGNIDGSIKSRSYDE